jgi:ABC-type transport system involved in cytochrome c biogenesis permease component
MGTVDMKRLLLIQELQQTMRQGWPCLLPPLTVLMLTLITGFLLQEDIPATARSVLLLLFLSGGLLMGSVGLLESDSTDGTLGWYALAGMGGDTVYTLKTLRLLLATGMPLVLSLPLSALLLGVPVNAPFILTALLQVFGLSLLLSMGVCLVPRGWPPVLCFLLMLPLSIPLWVGTAGMLMGQTDSLYIVIAVILFQLAIFPWCAYICLRHQ